MMVCKPVDEHGKPGSGYVVAADAVGAGVGEMVLYATGSSARQTVQTNNRPCDAVIMGIVDNWEVDGEFRYKKSEDH
jgi:microcompartment protein CcmK/EutM